NLISLHEQTVKELCFECTNLFKDLNRRGVNPLFVASYRIRKERRPFILKYVILFERSTLHYWPEELERYFLRLYSRVLQHFFSSLKQSQLPLEAEYAKMIFESKADFLSSWPRQLLKQVCEWF